MTLDELLAREGIRKTIARYTDAGDNGRYDDLIRCYAADGIFEIATGRWQGRMAIEHALSALRAGRSARGVRLQRHHLGTCHIEMDGPEAARSITYFTVVADTGLDHAGRYIDRHVRREGEWRFKHRQVIVDWMTPTSRFSPVSPENTPSRSSGAGTIDDAS